MWNMAQTLVVRAGVLESLHVIILVHQRLAQLGGVRHVHDVGNLLGISGDRYRDTFVADRDLSRSGCRLDLQCGQSRARHDVAGAVDNDQLKFIVPQGVDPEEETVR